jgi:hypothetical protein
VIDLERGGIDGEAMQIKRPQPIMEHFRRWARPSTAIRLAWLAVVALHVWLVARRVGAGEWGTAVDVARGTLCAAGVAYASLKFWSISTVFDNRPRRAMAFLLVVTLGHAAWHPAAETMTSGTVPGAPPVQAVAVMMPIVAMAVLGLGLAAWMRGRTVAPAPARVRIAGGGRPGEAEFDFHHTSWTPHLGRRPPPGRS